MKTPPTDCRRCPRLAEYRAAIKAEEPEYFCAPVPSFGVDRPQLLVVGLAPGKHGANRTGRPFTGDYAGELLYQTLYDFGWSSQARSTNANDGLELLGARITNAVRCVPPDNQPLPVEAHNCNPYLAAEIAELAPDGVVLALGNIAFSAVLRTFGFRRTSGRFAHGAQLPLPAGQMLFGSYHCSRYNTQTRRLTAPMFRSIFEAIGARFGR